MIANPETGILNVRATSRQHEKVQEFLDQVMASAKRQVLIEATVAEVQLNNEYQRGIDWQRLRTGAATSAAELRHRHSGSSSARARRHARRHQHQRLRVRRRDHQPQLQLRARLLESFGDVRVLSSPKISVLNNQTAVLRGDVDDLVYFTHHAVDDADHHDRQGWAASLTTSFTTTLERRCRGLHDGVLPQISDADAVVLNVRPTIRAGSATCADPNPALQGQTDARPDPGDRDARDRLDPARCRAARSRCSAG